MDHYCCKLVLSFEISFMIVNVLMTPDCISLLIFLL